MKKVFIAVGIGLLISVAIIIYHYGFRMEKTLQLNGKNVYKIVYEESQSEEVQKACEALYEYLGGEFELVEDEDAQVDKYEMLIGNTNRPESAKWTEGLGEHDYRIVIEGKKLILTGGSDVALINGIAYLMRSDAISIDDDGTRVIAYDYSVHFDGADNRDEYIADPRLFLCNWILEFETPEWMVDFEEKIAAFNDGDGRMLSGSHRGDRFHYPENSIEAIISAIKMGADNIEVDIQKTKDGVLVLMHDESLLSTTDVRDKAGKNGLPESTKLSDWTYEELCQLRLTTYKRESTDYLIPTFEEVLKVCNERATIRLDKQNNFNWDTDIYPLIEKTGAWRAVIPNWHLGIKKMNNIRNTIKLDSGIEPLIWYKVNMDYVDEGKSNGEEWLSMVEGFRKDGYFPILRWGDFNIKIYEKHLRNAKPYLDQIKDDVRIYIDAQATSGGMELPEVWDALYENGVDFIMVDDILKLQKYIADNFEATSY